jgi:hypothetical protein
VSPFLPRFPCPLGASVQRRDFSCVVVSCRLIASLRQSLIGWKQRHHPRDLQVWDRMFTHRPTCEHMTHAAHTLHTPAQWPHRCHVNRFHCAMLGAECGRWASPSAPVDALSCCASLACSSGSMPRAAARAAPAAPECDVVCAWRRWDDDVVFKNQTRGQPKVQKRFINDTIRNDFHRRFLQRYIK